jgi:perosamine synthetase
MANIMNDLPNPDETDPLMAAAGRGPAVTLPHLKEWPVYDDETADRVRRLVLEGRTFDYGRRPELDALEDAFAAYHGGGLALTVNSGTSALLSAFIGVGISPGDEVLCPAATFIATVTPLLMIGAVPVLCDCEPDTGNIDPADAESRITPRTRAIVVTHLWGHPCAMDEIVALAERHQLSLIEDCSHAHGATYKGRIVGTFGDAAAFSIGSGKMVSGGMAGMLLTRDHEVYDRACLLGHFRRRSRETVKTPSYAAFSNTGYGANLRASPVAAVLALSHLRQLDSLIDRKRQNLERLSAGLADIGGFEPPLTRPAVTRGAWYGYKVRWQAPGSPTEPSIEDVVRALKAEGCDVDPPGSPPLNTLMIFQTADNRLYRPTPSNAHRFTYKVGDFPVAEAIYRKTMSFPANKLYGDVTPLIDQYVLACTKVAIRFGTHNSNA